MHVMSTRISWFVQIFCFLLDLRQAKGEKEIIIKTGTIREFRRVNHFHHHYGIATTETHKLKQDSTLAEIANTHSSNQVRCRG